MTNNNSSNIINKKEDQKFEVLNYFNINEIITALEFFPDGNKLAIGTHKGKILVYKLTDNIRYDYCFYCRNKYGVFSRGKKITSIHFIDKIRALITTSDSRIRLVSMDTGKMLYKYKGHQNLNSMIRSSTDLLNDVLISGSEDNFCYVWDLFNSKEKEVKNYGCEYFKSFSRENIYCSLIVPEICYTNYIKKIYKLTNKINIISIIMDKAVEDMVVVGDRVVEVDKVVEEDKVVVEEDKVVVVVDKVVEEGKAVVVDYYC